jgi:hypothetical protein
MGGGHGLYGFLYMKNRSFFVRNSRKTNCVYKKTCEFAYKNGLYFHQYRKKQWICSFFFMSIFLLFVFLSPRKTKKTVFWGKWGLEILIFSFGIGKLPAPFGFCKICVKSGFSGCRRSVQFWFLLEGLFAAKCQKV